MTTDNDSLKVPLNETAEHRRARMRELASRGGKAARANEKNAKRLRDLTTKILNAPIPLNGKLAEILYKVGINTNDKTSAAEGIIGVFTAKALSGDLKAAQFVFDSAGWSGNAQVLMARVNAANTMIANPEATVLEAPKRSEHLLDLREIDAEAARMGLYETMERPTPATAEPTESEVIDD